MDPTSVDGRRVDSFRPFSIERPRVRPPSTAANADAAATRAACRQMEALFLNHLLKEMRATVDESGFLSGGRAERIYTGMLDEQLSQDLSRAGGIGLAQVLYRQLNPSESADAQPGPAPRRSPPNAHSASISAKDSVQKDR